MEQTLEHTWKLEDLYTSLRDPRLTADLEAASQEAAKYNARYAGKIAGFSPKDLATAVAEYEVIYERAYKPVLFASLSFSADTQNSEIKALLDKARQMFTDIRNQFLFLELELKALPQDKAENLLKAPELADLEHWLVQLRKLAPFTLSEKEEKILNLKQLTGRSAWSQFYTEHTSRFRFKVIVNGEEKELNDPETRALRRHQDSATRRSAHHALYSRYQEEAPTLAYIFNTVFQDHLTDVNLRGFDHPLTPTAMQDELSVSEIQGLLEATAGHYHLVERYHLFKAKRLGTEKVSSADLLAPVGQEPKLSYAEAKDLVLEAFERFSPKIQKIALEFFDKRWIDVYPRAGKRGGAFCSYGLPSTHPYVFLNHTDDLDSAHTLAHELGHAIHAYLFNGQRLVNFGATTPLAETASVFAEILLDDLMLERLKTPHERMVLMANRVEDCVATAFRQVMYTRWELAAVEARKQGVQPAEFYNQLWKDESLQLYGKGVDFTDIDWVAWSGIPHFIGHRFYCYSYAYGYLLVLALYNRYLEEGKAFVPKYLDILAAGESQTPQQILARAGINPANPGFWAGSFKVVEGWLKELEATA